MPSLLLECLPNEVLLSIMGSISAPQDYLSLLRASPQFFRVSARGNHAIVKAIVKRTIAPENMPLALAACSAPTVLVAEPPKRLLGRSYVGSEDADQTTAGLMDLKKECDSLSEEQLDPNGWSALFKLCIIVNELIDEFFHDAMCHLNSVLALKAAKAKAAKAARCSGALIPSDVERARLQRAFFRFEVLRKSYLTGYLIFNWGYSDYGTLFRNVFMSNVANWQREELSSVFAWLQERLDDTFTVAKSHVNTVLETAIKEDRHPLALLSTPQYYEATNRWDRCPESQNFLEVKSHPLKDFCWAETDSYFHHLDFMMALGLPFLRHLWRLPLAERASILSFYGRLGKFFCEFDSLFRDRCFVGHPVDTEDDDESASGGNPPSASGVTDDDGAHKERHLVTTTPSVNGVPVDFVDGVSQPNSAWLWGNQFEEGEFSLDYNYTGYGVAKLGLMFWDKPRLERLGLFDYTLLEFETCIDAEETRLGTEEPIPNILDEFFKRSDLNWLSIAAIEKVAPTLTKLFDERRTLRKLEYMVKDEAAQSGRSIDEMRRLCEPGMH